MARQKISFKDVGRAAGVSVSTAYRVARDSPSVDPKLRKLVKEAAAKLGFALQPASRVKALAFVLSNRSMLHPFHSHILVGAEAHCRARGWDVVFLTFRYDLQAPRKKLLLPGILERGDLVRAVILAGTNAQNLLDLLSYKRIPFVVFGNNVVGEWRKANHDAVFVNEIQGAYEMTRHLQGLGHRDIWFVGNCRLPWYARAFEGYRHAMEEAGLPARRSEIESEDSNEVGYLAAKSIVSRGEAISAIFAGSDDVAQGVYKALRDCQLRIPHDISVAGCNDTIAALLQPPLTSIREFPTQLGKFMVDLILNRIANPELPPQQVTIPYELVIRGSCRALPHGAQAAGDGGVEKRFQAQAGSTL